MQDTLTAKEVCVLLEIKPQTLYAYVSRGLISSVPIAGNSRRCRYLRSDVDQLMQKKQLHQQPEQTLQNALHWGAPLLTTRVSRIANGQLYYRDQLISDLMGKSFEDVLKLLWSLPESIDWPLVKMPKLKLVAAELPFLLQVQSALILLAAVDDSSHTLTAQRITNTGTQILNSLVKEACGSYVVTSVAHTLQVAWNCSSKMIPCLNSALILCAEHELNTSTFTGRCIASSGANLYEVIIGALAAFSGNKHGGILQQIYEQLTVMLEQPETYLMQRLRQGSLTGFHHALYPQGDPRAILLLAMVSNYAEPARYKKIQKIVNFFGKEGLYPSIDFALVAMEYCLQLPQDSGLKLFTIARTVGWVAHALEQYQRDQQIRPRSGSV